jgi:uncharacterized protein YfcZ (UPF0381/DUF406 family)
MFFQRDLSFAYTLFFTNRRKTTARIAELEDLAEQARNRANKLEKDKNKLQLEIRDLTIQLEAVWTFCLLF